MKKLLFLLSSLIIGLVLVSCEVTVTPLTDWVVITDNVYEPMDIEKGNSKSFSITIDATEYISDEALSVSVTKGGVSAPNSGISVTIPDFNAMDTTVTLSMNVASTTTAGTYSVKITAKGVDDSDYTVISVVVSDGNVAITSVSNASLTAGASTSTSAKIANGSNLTTSNFSVSVAGLGAPVVSIDSYNASTGTLTIAVNGANATAGSYTGTLTVGSVSKTFSITVNKAADYVTISSSVSSLEIEQNKTGSFNLTMTSLGNITRDSLSYKVEDAQNSLNDYIELGADAFNSDDTTVSASLTVNSLCVPGVYTVTIYAEYGTAKDSAVVTVTVTEAPVPVTEKMVKLYNPYAKDGFNSALNIVTGDPVAGSLASDNTHMEYAAADSLVADIAVDNSADIRATNVVAELTSINGGKFVKITKAQYDAVTTEAAVKALAAGKSFVENEVIITDQDDITVDGFFIMELANNRGYAAVQMKELNTTDTEGSTGNTGYLQIGYKFTTK